VEQVEVTADPALKGVEAAVEVEMIDGSKLSARCVHPRGSYENPLSRAEVEGKFRTYAKGVLPDATTDEIIGAVNRLEDLASVRKLMDLLHRPQRQVGERAA
jgi:2-methylcitrate dehydratase PrpD